MKTALLRLLGSMKFWTALLGLASAQAAKYGLEVDEGTYWSIVAITGVLIGAQGLADQGKAKAEIETRHIQSGAVRLEVLALVFFCGASATVAACGWLKSETKQTATDVIDCTTAKALELAKEFGPTVDQVLTSYLSDTGTIDRASLKALAKSYATDGARCVLARAVARLLEPRGQDSQSAPLPIDTADVAAAWAEVRRDELGGKTFVLGDS